MAGSTIDYLVIPTEALPLNKSAFALSVTAVFLVLAFPTISKKFQFLYSQFWNLDVSEFPNKVLDLYIWIITRGLPVRHQYVRGQDKMHETRGKTFAVTNFGTTSVYTMESENVQSVWGYRFDDWEVGPIRFPVTGAFVGKGIVTTDGDRWTHVRQVAKYQLAREKTSDLLTYKRTADKWIGHLPKTEKYVDLQPFFFDMYFEACFVFLMGKRLDDEDMAAIGCDLTTARCLLDNGVRVSKMRSFRPGPLKKYVQSEQWAKSRAFADRYSEHCAKAGIAWREDPSTDQDRPTCLIQRLALAFEDMKDLKNEVLHFTIGTHSTVSGLLTHTCLQLLKRPDIWKQLHEEASNAKLDANGVPDFANLSILHNVVKEALRLYPSTAFSSRVAKCDTILPRGGGADGGDALFVRKGSRIHANIFALHRNESIYGPNPYNFNPERWSSIKPKPWDFMPFSRGKRVCLGKEKGLREAKYMIFKLAQQYKEMKVADNTNFAEATNAIPVTCRVVLVPA